MSGLLYGRNPVLEALKSGRPMERLLVMETGGKARAIIQLAEKKGIAVKKAHRNQLDELTGGARHQGFLAYVTPRKYVPLEELLQVGKEKQEPHFLIALDHLEDPHNFGAILRVADGAGAHGVIVPKARSVSLSDTVAKTSAVAVEFVPVAQVSNLNQTLVQLKKQGLWIVGLDGEAADTIYTFDWQLPLVLVVGSEGKGLSRLIKENCDFMLSIPMRGQINSLNASVATALAIYEGVRQRGLER